MRLLFGDLAFDPEAHELRRAGEPVPLSPKAFHLLAVLLEARPRALSKEELLERLWPGVFVAEGSLTGLVSELRHAIGEHGRSGHLRTVHGFGYAFSGDVRAEEEPPPPRFWLSWGGRELPLSEGDNVLGRDLIGDATVSRRHVRIVVRDGAATVEDLESKNGTFLGAERVTAAVPLEDGAVLKLGSAVLGFHDRAAVSTTRTLRG